MGAPLDVVYSISSRGAMFIQEDLKDRADFSKVTTGGRATARCGRTASRRTGKNLEARRVECGSGGDEVLATRSSILDSGSEILVVRS